MVLWSVSTAALALALASALADLTLDEVPLVQRGFNEKELSTKPTELGKQPAEKDKLILAGILRTRGALAFGSNTSRAHRERKARRAQLHGSSGAGEQPAGQQPAGEQPAGQQPGAQQPARRRKEPRGTKGQCTKQERLNIKDEDAELENTHNEEGDMAIVAKAPAICTEGPITYANSKPCLSKVYDISDSCAECPRLFMSERFESCSNRCEYEKLYCPEDPDQVNRSKQCFQAMGVCDGCRLPVYKKRMRCEGGMRDEARTFKAFDNYVEECERGTMTPHKYRLFRKEVETKNVEDPPMPRLPPKTQSSPKQQAGPSKAAPEGKTGWDVTKENEKKRAAQSKAQNGQPHHPPRASAAQKVAHPGAAKAQPHKPKTQLSKASAEAEPAEA